MGAAPVSKEQRLTATVSGWVQGVGYRAFARREALRLGLRGYARNLPDGSVEVLAEGSDEALRRLLIALRTGPIGSRVERVDESFDPASGGLSGFGIG